MVGADRWHSGLALRVVEGPGAGQTFHLVQEKVMMGRARAQAMDVPGWVLLADRAVSRHHATLIWQEAQGGFALYHQSETNYTWVNGEVIESRSLQPGDEIKMGTVVLRLETADPEQAPEPAPVATISRPSVAASAVPTPARASQPLSLQVGAGHLLRLQGGADGLCSVSLDGLVICLGRGNYQPESDPDDPNPLVFDRLVELLEPQLGPNHFIFRWNESQQTFGVWKHPGTASVPFLRRQDGFEWHGWLEDQGVTLREGDTFTVGSTVFTLERPVEQRSTAIKL